MPQNESEDGRAETVGESVVVAKKASVKYHHAPSPSRRPSNRYRQKFSFIVVVWSAVFLYFSITSEIRNQVVALPSQDRFAAEDSSELKSNEAHDKYSVPRSLNSITESPDDGKINEKWATMGNLSRTSSVNTEKEPLYKEVPGFNCTPPGIDDFPSDLFTPEQRKQGYVLVHALVSLYIFLALAIVCDDYFVPSMECICEGLKMPTDVAGATFMAIATSAPELFTNIIGTFITKGDVGIGTIVGSAVFNILAVAAVCGIGAGMVVPLDWWSVTRDCICYSISVVLLIIVLRDEKIFWYEALVLVLVYLFYILAMWQNSRLKEGAEWLVSSVEQKLGNGKMETTYTMKDAAANANGKGDADDMDEKPENLIENAVKNMQAEAEAEKENSGLCRPPSGRGCWAIIKWLVQWPIVMAYTFTIPDCREERWRKWYPLTFFMCVVWIGILAYLVNWMMTIIGYTFSIPDTIMGLTFIAAGTSVPEVASSIIVARQGLGSMALSNSIGSNTFDILMCLGVPWLIRASMIAKDTTTPNYIQINSTGIEYSTLMLMGSLAVLYIILFVNKFVLDKRVGFTAAILYSVFLVFACLFESNVFFQVNMPTCKYHLD